MKPAELKQMLASGKPVRIFDVRENEEYETGEKMAEAQNMPMGKVFLEAFKGNLPKDEKIVTVCKSGTRCEIVARELRQRGFDIDHLEGGIEAWKHSGA